MQIGEQHLVAAHPVVLRGDRLFDFEHQLGVGPDIVSRAQDGSAGCDILVVADRTADSCASLNADRVPVVNELFDP